MSRTQDGHLEPERDTAGLIGKQFVPMTPHAPSPLREPSETPERDVTLDDRETLLNLIFEQISGQHSRYTESRLAADVIFAAGYRRSALPVETPELKAVRREVADRITQYLSVGGTWNPEMMDHDKVRDLLFDCRDALTMEAK